MQILVVGGGKVALHKIQLLQRFTEKIKVIAPEIRDEIKGLEGVECEPRGYQESDLQGCLLVYAATNNHRLNLQIKDDGIKYNCLVNVVDNPKHSDFVSPAIIKFKNMTVAVGSDGEDVLKSIRIRNKIKDFLQQEGEL